MTDNRGFVYAVSFSNGVIKVGMTRRKSKVRTSTYTSFASLMGCKVDRVWQSVMLDNRITDEKILIDFCGRYGSKYHGYEWFKNIDFDDLVRYAEENVTESIYEDHETPASVKNEKLPRPVRMDDIEWEAFRLLLGATWLRKQIDRAIKKDQRKPTAQKTEG